MATTSEKLSLLITADVKGAVKGFEKVGKSADRELGRADKKLDKTAARLTKMGAASLATAGVMAAALASTIGPASDLNEAINLSQLTFGDASKGMEAWAETTADSIGQSKRAALQGAAAIGGLLQNVGFLQDEAAPLSQSLVGLASDMASAFDTAPADALEAIRSGLSGQSEPLRKYNVFLSEAQIKIKAVELGLGDGTRALSENEKAQARLAIITEQTSLIQGDFANTAESAANAQRRMSAQFEDTRASIGQAVLPLFEELLKVTNGIFGAFNSLSPETKELVGKIILLSTAVLALGGGMSMAVGKAIKMRKVIKDLRANGLSKATVATGALTLVVAGLGLAWKQHNDRAAEARELLDGFADAMADANSPVEGVITQLRTLADENDSLRETFAKLGQDGVRELAAALLDGGEITEEFAGKLLDAAGGVTEAQRVMRELTTAVGGATDKLGDMDDITGESIDSMNLATRAWKSGSERVDALADSSEDLADATEDAAAETKNFEKILKKEAKKFDDVRDAAKGAKAKIDDYFGVVRDGIGLQLDMEEAIDDTVAAQKDNELSLDRNTEAGLNNWRAGLNLLDVLQDVMQAKLDETGSTEDATKAGQDFVDQLQDEMIASGLAEDAVGEFTDALGLIPGDYVATLTVKDRQALTAAEELEELLKSIEEHPWTFAINAQVGTPQLSPDFLDFGGGKAATGLGGGRGFDPGGSFFVQRAKAGDDALKQANIDVAQAKGDLSDAESALATSRAEIAQAKKDIAAAKESGDKDALATARSERDAARRDRDAAKEDIARATAAQIEAERKVAEANKEIADAKRGLAISTALAGGDTVGARQLGVDQARADLAFVTGQGAGVAVLTLAQAAIVDAEARLRQAQDKAAQDILDGVPKLAHGGIVKARAGGTLALLGEAGRDEEIRPLPKGGGGGTINITVTNPDPDAVVRAIEQAQRQGRIGSLAVA